MALVKGTNSFVSLDEADSYFSDRLDVAAWTEADDSNKSKALVTATSMLNEMTWAGVAVSVTQPLAFPRNGTYVDPRAGCSMSINSEIATSRIKMAQIELAYHLLNNDGLLDDTGSVDALQISGISLTKVKNPSKVPDNVNRIIRPLLLNRGASHWWRAN